MKQLNGSDSLQPFDRSAPDPSDQETLVDLSTVTVNTDLPKSERIRDFVTQIKNPYCFRLGEYVVEISYADSGRSLEELVRSYILSKL